MLALFYSSLATPASGDDPDGNGPLLTRASSVRRSTLSVSSTATVGSTSGTMTSSPPVSPSLKEVCYLMIM